MRTKITILGVLVAVAAASMGAADAGLPGEHGCVATAGDSCTFVGDPAGIPSGVASATSGAWAVTHQAGGVTVTDVAGTGPNAFPFIFADGVLYTLTVGADGAGAVTAGSPEPTLPPLPPVPPLPPLPPLPPVPQSPAHTPIVFACAGTGGWENNPFWGTRWTTKARAVDVLNTEETTCGAWSPDTAKPPSALPYPHLLLDYQPVGGNGSMKLNSVGDFACGDGTLTTAWTSGGASIGYWHGFGNAPAWTIDWNVTFSDGLGQVSGTAWRNLTGEVRTLSGTVVVDDGAAIGRCDDSAFASDVYVYLILS